MHPIAPGKATQIHSIVIEFAYGIRFFLYGVIVCGRFTIISDPVAFQLEFDISINEAIFNEGWKTRYNIAPTQVIPVINNSQEHKLALMQWGLLPNWATNKKDNFRLINIRAESIPEKATFRKLVQRGQRCLILADGFFEWQTPRQPRNPKIPFYFHLKDHKPFAFAGLWDNSTLPDGETAKTCAIITCIPNVLIRPIHERMPVILNKQVSHIWLEDQPIDQLLSLLKPFPDDEMTAYPVSPLVNSPANDLPECILPINN